MSAVPLVNIYRPVLYLRGVFRFRSRFMTRRWVRQLISESSRDSYSGANVWNSWCGGQVESRDLIRKWFTLCSNEGVKAYHVYSHPRPAPRQSVQRSHPRKYSTVGVRDLLDPMNEIRVERSARGLFSSGRRQILQLGNYSNKEEILRNENF